ncbi:GLIPR1-like protein 1 [Diadema setosum]|uniref:GLIPR1-like protein 1 n=1 Tax=Diadema setosum TaxID=31175 RepID=UPI003B3B8132
MDLSGTIPHAPPTSMLGMTPEAERQTERSRGDFETREGCKGLESLLPPRGEPRGNRLSPGEKMVFLSAHNEFRGMVNPEAANMVQLQWDGSLAQMAQQWADRCKYGHGNPKNISPYSWVGQNIWAGSGTGWDHYGMVENWYSEAEDYHFANNTCSGVCGHYTQMMWAETTHVGCAVAVCSTLENLDWSPATILVCNYGEGGNYVGKRPYVRGRSCSKCPSVHHVCVNNLCAGQGCEDVSAVSGGATAAVDELKPRKQQAVIVNGTHSSWMPVTSGVPQGSVFGLVLLLLYINSININIKSKMHLFADDSHLPEHPLYRFI